MTKYGIVIKGSNFLLDLDGELRQFGFFTTRYVEAQDVDTAVLQVMDLIRNDKSLRPMVQNDRSNPPIMHPTEIFEIDPSEELSDPGRGFAFYVETDEEDELDEEEEA